jgi:hypothetical protein
MKNKNLRSLLETVANQQEPGETPEVENLGAELAAKLKGGVAGTGTDTDDDDSLVKNSGCTQNTGCGVSV